MGKGTIASGGTDGLYQVTLDYGAATRDNRVAALTAELESLEVTLTALQSALDTAQATEDAQKTVVNAAIESYVIASNAVAPSYDAIQAAATALQIAKDALANLIDAPAGTLPDVSAMQAGLADADTAQQDARTAALAAGTATGVGADAVLAALTLLDATNTDFDAAQGTLASTQGSTDAATAALVLALQAGGSSTAEQNAFDAATDASDTADDALLQITLTLLDVVNTLDASQLDLRDLQTTDQAPLVDTALGAASAYAADGQALLAVYMAGGDASEATKGALQANLNAAHSVFSGQTLLVQAQADNLASLRSTQDPLEDARTSATEDLQNAVSDVQISTSVLASERAGYVAAATAAPEVFDAAAVAYAAALDDYEAAHDALVQAQTDYLAAHDAATAAFDNTRIALAVLESEFVNLDMAAADYAGTAAPLLSFFLTPEAVDAGRADAEAAVTAAQAILTQANTDYQTLQDAVPVQLKAYTDAASELAKLKGATAVARVPLELMKARKTQLTKDKATWTALVLTETVPAWCADLTEDASGQVATIEVPGENKLVLIAPEGRAPTAADGLLTAREVQSAAQVFWNAAVLPGWQKWKPTYRTGTITALDEEADTASVTLESALSSAQHLNVNQVSSLTAVPVEYMTCNASAFEVGDKCLVRFTGQDQASPKVVGFKDHPKACSPPFVLVPVVQQMPTEWIEEGSYTAFTSVYGYIYPQCGLDRTPFSAGTAQAYENYLFRRIVAGGAVYFPGTFPGWTAPAQSSVILWEEKHGTIQDAPLASAVPVAHKTYNTSWVVGVSFGGLYIRSRTWPWGEHELPSTITPHWDTPACSMGGYTTAIAHIGLTSVSFDLSSSVDDLGYPIMTPVVEVIDTSEFSSMAAFLGTAAKVPPTVTITKGERTMVYEYDGVFGAGEYGPQLWVKYKRPKAT